RRDASAEPHRRVRRTSGIARRQRQMPGKDCKWKISWWSSSALSWSDSLAHRLFVVPRRRQDRRLVGGRFLLLDFHFRNQNGGSRGGNRHGARFGSAISVEGFHGVACGHDFCERNERRADDIHSAYELIG